MARVIAKKIVSVRYLCALEAVRMATQDLLMEGLSVDAVKALLKSTAALDKFNSSDEVADPE
jgi:hypothetical protein